MTSGELAVRARVALLFAPVGVRNYRLFWIAAAAWSGAVSMQTLALAVIALDLTGRPSGWAAVLTAQAVARGVLLPIGGVTADLFGVRGILVVFGVLQAMAGVAVAVASLAGALALSHLLGYALVAGAIQALFMPALLSITPELVPTPALHSANALSFATTSSARVAGPVAAGALLTVFGASATLAAGAACCLFAAACVSRIIMPAHAQAQPATPLPLEAAGQGWRALRSNRVLMALIVPAILLFVGYTATIFIGLPSLARLTLGMQPLELGILYAAVGGGTLLGAVATGCVPGTEHQGIAGAAAVIGSGLAVLSLTAVDSLVWIVLLLVAGGTGTSAFLMFVSVLQSTTEAHVRARVASLVTLAIVAVYPATFAVAGWVGDRLGPRAVVALAGVAMALAGTLALSRADVRSLTIAAPAETPG